MSTQALPYLLLMLSCVPNIFTFAAISQNTCPPSTISVRVPPYLDPALNGTNATHSSSSSSFLAPPLDWYTGTWYQTNTSLANYRGRSNLQWDVRAVLPSCTDNSTATCPPGTLDGTMFDLTTWANDAANANASNFGALGGGGRSLGSTFGYDTPRRLSNPELGPEWDGVFGYEIAGSIAFNQSWSVLYWGLDAKSVPYLIVHESIPGVVDAFTRSMQGPDEGSLQEVLEALTDLGNDELNDLLKQMGPTKYDYELAGGAPICGKGCLENKAE